MAVTVQRIASLDEEYPAARWIILFGLITAAILEVLDTTIVNVALPQMAGNLGATTTEIGWVSTGYILSNVIVLPMTAWLSSRFGRRNYMTGSIILFVVASLLCGMASSLQALVFWRIVQGAGGAALLSTAQATLREIFPREQQGMVQAIYILGIIVAPTVGPTLGGWITDNYSWPWVFYVNLPIGAISAFIVYTFLSDANYKKRSLSIDFLGIGLLATGLGTLQYVLEEGNQEYWFESAFITRLTIISVVSLVSLVAWELSPRNKHPIVNLRVMKNRELSAALFLFVALGFGLYGGIFLFPLFAQNILGFTPTITGLTLLPGGIATGIGAIVCGRLLSGGKPRISPRLLIFIGMSMFLWSIWDLGHLTGSTSESDVRLALIFRGAGLGLLFTPINLAAFSTLKGPEIAEGSAMMNLMRQLGGSFGIAVLSNYLTTRTAVHRATLVSNLIPGNPNFDNWLSHVTGAMSAKGYNAGTARQAALGILDGTVDMQAITQAFNDSFLFIGLTLLITTPAILLLRTGGSPRSSSQSAH